MENKDKQGCHSCMRHSMLTCSIILPSIIKMTKLDVHQCLIVIYICFKFDEIRFRGYLVIANYMAFKSIQGL